MIYNVKNRNSIDSDTVRGMSRLLGNAMSALVLVFALGSSRASAAASSVVCEFCSELAVDE